MTDKENQNDDLEKDNNNESQPEETNPEEESKSAEANLSEENKPAEIVNKKIQDSNYQISLVDENHLKVKISSGKGIKIECLSKDKDSGKESQTNRIYLHPKPDGESREIEVIIAIDSEGNLSIPEKKKTESGLTEEPAVVLTPNPELADLIKNSERNLLEEEEPTAPKTPEEELQEKIDKGNPFIKFRQFYQKNLTVGIIAAIAIHIFAVTIYFANAPKKGDVAEEEPQRRLIIIQDLPEPKINLQNVEDPNAPPEEENTAESSPKELPRTITRSPRISRPPTVNKTPETKTSDTTNISDENRTLDSLRKLAGNDTGAVRDTSIRNLSDYQIPDSLKSSFSENEVGLSLNYPKNWKLIDSRDVNTNIKNFEGVVLTDTTKESGDFSLFIHLDMNGSEYNKDRYKAEFPMNDTTLTAFYREPYIEAAFMKYQFYIFNNIGTEKLSVDAQVRKQLFEDYKKDIEAVVRSISIKKPSL